MSDAHASGHQVRYEGAVYEIRPDETVLDGLVRGGANVSFSCRRGTCQVCMLHVQSGDPGDPPESLDDVQRAAGLFLPCKARPRSNLVVTRPDLSSISVPTVVREREQLSASVVRLVLEPESMLSWRAGQFISIAHPTGALRSYSIASILDEDFYLDIHVRRVPGGLVSGWLCDDVAVGDVLSIRAPAGTCFLDPEPCERELLLIAGGTGLAPLLGIARDALRRGDQRRIHLFHGSANVEGLYLRDRLVELARTHERFHYEAWLDDADAPLPAGVRRGAVLDAAFAEPRAGAVLFLAGSPEMVYEARYRAVLAGIARADIRADPFEGARPLMPDDKAKMLRVEPDPELWDALDRGPGLTAILHDFYGHAFEDPRLAPFFHNVTKARAIEKQYEFLSDLFTGSGHYFGARPFNAHHWMVISDELFDYREARLDEAIRRHGLPEHLHRRWSAIHELFRREIVKTHRRGLILDGVERLEDVEERFREEVLTIDSICDACVQEVLAGTAVRHQPLTGRVYCMACSTPTVTPHASTAHGP